MGIQSEDYVFWFDGRAGLSDGKGGGLYWDYVLESVGFGRNGDFIIKR